MTYNSWKLATPPEYEFTGKDEQELEIRNRDAVIDKLVDALDAIVGCATWSNSDDGIVCIDRTAYEHAKKLLATIGD